MLEVGHIRLRLAVEVVEPANLTVVEQVGDDSGDVGGIYTGRNVLTVPSAVDSLVVGVPAASGDLGRCAGERRRPGEVRRGVIVAVDVVVEQRNVGVRR